MKILCMGQIIYDYSLPIDGFPLEGLKYNLKEKIECSGGGACNSSFLLAKWNEDVHLSAAVGGDELGTKIRKNMEEAGINVSNVETVFEAKTPIEFILINKNTGNKTVFSINESTPHVKKYELDFVPDIILLDGYEYTSAISVVNRFPNATVILDASIQERSTVEMLNYAKYIIASQGFAEEFTGIKADFNNPTTLLEMYKKFAIKYPNNNIIVTLKDHGAMYLDGNQIKVMPGINVDKIVDNTGAGDIFRAAFACCISRGYDMDKTIRIANIAAGLSLSKLGAKNSIPLFSDVAAIYESKFGPLDGNSNTTLQTVSENANDVQNTQVNEEPQEEIKEHQVQSANTDNQVNMNNDLNEYEEPNPLDQVTVPDIDFQAMPQQNDDSNDGTF
ncbi:MAG: carbohydrate kinase family protein [Firmicutes bacterium]|nr:carbohydrate kinase family protein [Bacillota bacterium]